jgi:hypothetical protein
MQADEDGKVEIDKMHDLCSKEDDYRNERLSKDKENELLEKQKIQ